MIARLTITSTGTAGLFVGKLVELTTRLVNGYTRQCVEHAKPLLLAAGAGLGYCSKLFCHKTCKT